MIVDLKKIVLLEILQIAIDQLKQSAINYKKTNDNKYMQEVAEHEEWIEKIKTDIARYG